MKGGARAEGGMSLARNVFWVSEGSKVSVAGGNLDLEYGSLVG